VAGAVEAAAGDAALVLPTDGTRMTVRALPFLKVSPLSSWNATVCCGSIKWLPGFLSTGSHGQPAQSKAGQ
jgi:hypothetical protein